MSTRYSLCATADQLANRFKVDVTAGYAPHYSAAPSQLLPVITNTGPQGLSYFYWGLAPERARNKPISEKIINTRAELITEKPVLRKTLAERRCLIPADGFYAWKKTGKKSAIPYRYTLVSKELFSIPGLWEEYEEVNGEFFHTFSMITCEANSAVAVTSERMPVLFNGSSEKIWLNPKADIQQLLGLLKPSDPALLVSYSVSPRINNADINDALLIRPAPAADQFGNLSLFD